MFVGFNLTFFPQFIAGYLGMPRRYHAYPPEFQVLNVLSTAGASILAVGYVLPLIYFTYSLVDGREVGRPIRGARRGLEWEIPSPPPTENFTVTPIVTHGHAPVRARARRSALSDAVTRRALSRARSTSRRCAANVRRRFPGEPRSEHAHHPKLQHHFDDMEQQAEASTLGMWVFLVTEIMFFGGLFMAYIVYRAASPEAFQEASHHLSDRLGRLQHRGPDRQLADDGAGGARGADQPAADAQVGWLVATMVLGAVVPRRQGDRVRRQVRAPHRARPELRQVGLDASGRRRAVLFAVLHA